MDSLSEGQSYSSEHMESPSFVEVTRRNLPVCMTSILDALQNSAVVSLALHSTIPSDAAHWKRGESLQEYYLRLVKLALHHEIFTLGISCGKLLPDMTILVNPTINRVVVSNFNFIIGTAEASTISSSALRRMSDLGYDLNSLAQESILYYRGRDDAVNHTEESKLLRDIFLAVHGNGSHPIVVKDGFSNLILAYTALSGLPGDGAEEFLQRLDTLFPGKVLDMDVWGDIPGNQSIQSPTFEFDVSGDRDNRFNLSEQTTNQPSKNCGSNISQPAVRDSFNHLKAFFGVLEAVDHRSIQQVVDKYGNRLKPVDAPCDVLIQPLANSKFRSKKKPKVEYDFTIPVTPVLDNNGANTF